MKAAIDKGSKLARAAMAKSKILVVGATGGQGKHLVKASIAQGHPTFVLVRPNTAQGAKKAVLDSFIDQGAVPLHGDLDDRASLVAALKKVDVVVSSVGAAVLQDSQLKLIEAIKQAGHIKRFFPSEYGSDAEKPKTHAEALLDSIFTQKRAVRKAIRDAGIPYTYVVNSGFAEFVVAPLAQLDIILSGTSKPPREKITIFGTGEDKLVATTQEDVANVTIKAVDDPRAENKQLVIRPTSNILTFNALVALWEKKIGHSLHKTFVPEAEVLKQIEGLKPPANMLQALFLMVTSEEEMFPLGPGDADANELYPDYKYVTLDQYLDTFVEKQ